MDQTTFTEMSLISPVNDASSGDVVQRPLTGDTELAGVKCHERASSKRMFVTHVRNVLLKVHKCNIHTLDITSLFSATRR